MRHNKHAGQAGNRMVRLLFSGQGDLHRHRSCSRAKKSPAFLRIPFSSLGILFSRLSRLSSSRSSVVSLSALPSQVSAWLGKRAKFRKDTRSLVPFRRGSFRPRGKASSPRFGALVGRVSLVPCPLLSRGSHYPPNQGVNKEGQLHQRRWCGVRAQYAHRPS